MVKLLGIAGDRNLAVVDGGVGMNNGKGNEELK
jgi:hypothetical protein